MVRLEGLEPPRLSALEPKSSVSANFTTGAYLFGASTWTRTRNLTIMSRVL